MHIVVVAAAVTALTLSCAGKKEPAKGQLMLAIQTDVSLPKDVDKLTIEVLSFGSLQFGNEYEVGAGKQLIPATLALIVGPDPSRPVTIRVLAHQGGKLRMLREVVTIDDEPFGQAPSTDSVLVDMGPRRLKITKPGFKDHTQILQVPGTTDVNVLVNLEREKHDGRLVVVAELGQTRWLDGKAVAQSRWESVVASGGHTLRITGQGKKPYQAEVSIRDNETRQLRITLDPDTPPPTAASNTWMWIAGGVIVSAGLVAGGYLLFKPKDEGAPAPVAGTMQPGTVQLPLLGWGR